MINLIKVILILGFILSLSCSSAIANDDKIDKAMENCIKEDIKQTNVLLIKDTYSDPGNKKQKDAKIRCNFEKTKSKKKFKEKYSDKNNK